MGVKNFWFYSKSVNVVLFNAICEIDIFFNLYFLFQALFDDYPTAVTEIFKAAELVEQCCKFIYLVVAEMTPLVILPNIFYCMYCYYVEDLGRDSFELADGTVW